MSSIDFSHPQAAAREVANDLRADDPSTLGAHLAAAYLSMGQDDGKFIRFLDMVKADNANDLKANSYQLPALEYQIDPQGNIRAQVDLPSFLAGYRFPGYKNEVFAAIKSSNPDQGPVDGRGYLRETVVVNNHSNVMAKGNVDVIAEKGSVVLTTDGATAFSPHEFLHKIAARD